MEIDAITRVAQSARTERKAGVARIQDGVTLSAEAQKLEKWAKMAKALPDVRDELIKAPRAPHSPAVFSEIAKRIL